MHWGDSYVSFSCGIWYIAGVVSGILLGTRDENLNAFVSCLMQGVWPNHQSQEYGGHREALTTPSNVAQMPLLNAGA